MAEFENGYCTGCGVEVRRWGHRPFCWRVMTMKHNLEPTKERIETFQREMIKRWPIRARFLVHPEHMYYWPIGASLNGHLPDTDPPPAEFELVQVHEAGEFAEVVIRDKNGFLVYAGNLQKMSNPRSYYAPEEPA